MITLQTAMIASQQAAITPGDEARPCEALHEELVSTMQDPAIRGICRQNRRVWEELEAQQQKKTPMTPQAAAALAAALAPGAGMAGMPAMPQVARGQTMTPQQKQAAMQDRSVLAGDLRDRTVLNGRGCPCEASAEV